MVPSSALHARSLRSWASAMTRFGTSLWQPSRDVVEAENSSFHYLAGDDAGDLLSRRAPTKSANVKTRSVMLPTETKTAAPRAKAHDPHLAKRPRFPRPVKWNGRKLYRRSAIETFKTELEAYALGLKAVVEPRRIEPDPMVPHKVVAAEFGVSTRTLDRWVAEAA